MAFVNYWLNENYKYNFIDLFCGSGGLSLGFSRALFKCELALDFEKSCIETFSYNHPNIKKSRIICDDIHNQTKKNWDNLKYLKNKKEIKDYFWLSNKNPSADHDFEVTDLNEKVKYIEVKSTKSSFETPFYWSSNEMNLFLNKPNDYLIKRIS